MTPCLLARTSRAGEHNHVDIHPPGVSVPDDFSGLVGRVKKGELTDGKSYLAATGKVTQTSGGRVGHETLLLYGVDVGRLAREGYKDAVLEELNRLHGELALLVTEGIDWKKCGPAPVARPELAAWCKRVEDANGGRALPVARSDASGRWLRVAAFLFVLALAGGGAAAYLRMGGAADDKKKASRDPRTKKAPKKADKLTPAESKDEPAPEIKQEQEEKQREEKNLGTLVKEWPNDRNAEKFTVESVRSLLEEAMPKRATDDKPEDKAKTRRAFREKLQALATDWDEGKPDKYYLSVSKPQQESLKVFLNGRSLNSTYIGEVRKELREFAGPVAKVLEAADEYPNGLSRSDKPDAVQASFFKLMKDLKNEKNGERIKYLRNYGDAKKLPSRLPLFDARDAEAGDSIRSTLKATAPLYKAICSKKPTLAENDQLLEVSVGRMKDLQKDNEANKKWVDRATKSVIDLFTLMETRSVWKEMTK